MPKVSVIIPLYNASSYLAQLKQLWEQTLSDFELILVDDCSADDTWEQLQRFKADYPERAIILARNERNLGPGGTRNHGLSLSSGQYVIFLDGDDRYEPTMLEKMAAKLDTSGADVVCCGIMRHEAEQTYPHLFSPRLSARLNCYNRKGGGKALPDLNTELQVDLLFNQDLHPSACNKMVRRNFLLEHNITFPNMRYGEDRCWNDLILLRAQTIILINEPLYHYLQNPNSITTTQISPRTMDAILELLEFKHQLLNTHDLLPNLNLNWQLYYWSIILYYHPRLLKSTVPQQRAALHQQFAARYRTFCAEHNMAYDLTTLPLAWRYPCYKLCPKVAPLILKRNQLKTQYQIGCALKRYYQLRPKAH